MKKEISYFTARSGFTGKPVKYAKIIVHDEPISIRGIKFKMISVYNAPAEDANCPKYYLQPLGHPNYNIYRAFRIYRQKTGFLFPKQIKHARRMAHLSLTETSAILGISKKTLSDIENAHFIQTESQDTILRFLFHKKCLAKLIEARLPLIKIKHYKHVDINHLKHVIERLIA